MKNTIRSADYNGTNEVTHYVDTSPGTYTLSLARVGKLMYWGGTYFCMKFYDLLSGKTHNVPCTELSVYNFAVYEKGKITIINDFFVCFCALAIHIKT